MHINELLYKLSDIGIALSMEQELNKLLQIILKSAREITFAEAGTLFLKEDDDLVFLISQNDALPDTNINLASDKGYTGKRLSMAKTSIAGFAAETKRLLNIPNVYDLSNTSEYSFDSSFDKLNNYKTTSMLVAPIVDPWHNVYGVIQLINCKPNGSVTTFATEYERILQSLASQAAISIRNSKLTSELKVSYLDSIYRLSVAAEYKDMDTASHIKRISSFSSIIADTLKLNDNGKELLKYGSPMHDIGKIGIPDSILLKPGKLTDVEWQTMKQHTIIGANLLANSNSEIFKASEVIALTHHEKWDGSGYPYNISGEEIPLFGRIVALADVFEALISKRCYKDAYPPATAVKIIIDSSGSHFDPNIIKAFTASKYKFIKIAEKIDNGEI